MMHEQALFVLLILALITLAFLHWAFIPHRKLSGHRVRVTRIRIRLRLHPGPRSRHRFRAVAALGPVRGVSPQPMVAARAVVR
jgi:hypothetical protein